ncbi:hypothetical protein AB5I41_21285 [Sphingomonas sp. MMS24-JH45]
MRRRGAAGRSDQPAPGRAAVTLLTVETADAGRLAAFGDYHLLISGGLGGDVSGQPDRGR